MKRQAESVEQILRKLISFDVLGGQSNIPIAHWIRDYLADFGLAPHTFTEESGKKMGVHVRIGPPVDGGIILSGHTDVVPVEGQDWNTHPFELVDGGDGKLYGRGSCDMKGFLACCLYLIPEMTRAKLQKPIYLAFSYDEEIGCQGAPALIRHMQKTYSENPAYAIIGEPSMMVPVIGQKGICVLRTVVNGSAGHSSRIRQEVSAVHEAARLINWIGDKVTALAGSDRKDNRFDPPYSTIHVGLVRGGIAPNVIADHAEFEWDIRVIPGDSVQVLLTEFQAFCNDRTTELRKIFPDFEITTTMEHSPVPPLDTSPSSSFLKEVQKWTGCNNWETVAYAAEAGQYSEAGYESIICGPGSIAQAHRANEFIDKTQLEKGLEMLRKMISDCSK